MPVLMRLAAITQGDILELGTGIYSTPLLHWSCRPVGRQLYSYDNEPRYFEFIRQYATDFHHVFFVENWSDIDIEKPWAFALIDHAPREQRTVDLARLKGHADYIVIHDTDPRQDKHYGFRSSGLLDSFKYQWTYRPMTSWTTVVSDKFDLSEFRL